LEHEVDEARAERVRQTRMTYLLVLAAVAALGLIAIALLTLRLKAVSRGAGPSPAAVETVEAVRTSVPITLSENAAVAPTPETAVMPQQVGWVQAIEVKPGQRVKSGDVVARIQPLDESAAQMADAYQMAQQSLSAARDELSTAENAAAAGESAAGAAQTRLTQAEADLAAARNAHKESQTELTRVSQMLQRQEAELQRNQNLLQQGAISRQELDQVKAARDQAAAERDQARAALEDAQSRTQAAEGEVGAARQALDQAQARVSDARAQVQAARAKVRSQAAAAQQAKSRLSAARRSEQPVELTAPTDGVVSAVPAKVGTLVTPAMAVVQIKRPDVAVVTFQTSEPQAAALKPGLPASVRAVGKAKGLPGRVTAVSPTTDKARNVRLEVADRDKTLNPGSRVTAEVMLGKLSAVAVPRSAVLYSKQGPEVWVAADGVAHIRRVTAARSAGAAVPVTAGLRPGEHIIVRANRPLKDGMPVRESRG